MKYFKNTELAKLYHVSEKSVRNWIDAAQNGKVDLQLFEHKGKYFVANTSKNTAIIEKLVERGKKYKNTRGHKNVEPREEFYKIFSPKQILDIISNLTIHHETPLQYTYVNGGAEDWNEYASKLYAEGSPNLLNQTIELLDVTAGKIDQLLQGYKKVNVVDLGSGNGLPVRSTLQRLLDEGRLGRYIPVDISQDMLKILGENIKEWFGDSVQFEPHIRDVSYERFNDILALEDNETVNLVFFLGGTLANFRSPEQVLLAINNSLGLNDILVHNSYLDTPKTRLYFDNRSDRKTQIQDGLILDFLNIDESYYDVEQIFDEWKRARSISIRPKVDLTIRFTLPHGERIVELHKNEPILIWRHWHKTAIELMQQFDQAGFDIIQSTKSPDGQYILLTCKIKTDS